MDKKKIAIYVVVFLAGVAFATPVKAQLSRVPVVSQIPGL
jgi:hypothetical protein